MTLVERYVSYKRMLARPTFDSIEDAEKNMRAKEGEFRSFVIREQQGLYVVCRCWINVDRQGNKKWSWGEDFRFSHSQMIRTRDMAALEVGRELVESM